MKINQKLSEFKNVNKTKINIDRQIVTDNRIRNREILNQKGPQTAVMLFLFIVAHCMLHYVNSFVSDYHTMMILMVMIKIIINTVLINIALIGMEHKKGYFDKKLLIVLILYAVGDIVATFSPWASGPLYTIGHILMVIILQKKTYIHKIHYVLFVLLYILNAYLVFKCNPGVVIFIAILFYIIPLVAFMVISFNSPFYMLAGLVFVISDVTGLFSTVVLEKWWTYIISNLIYYIAIMLISLSTFVVQEKQIVTFSEMMTVVKKLQKHNVRFWLAGSWNAGISWGMYFSQYKDIYIICDESSLNNLNDALREMTYIENDEVITTPSKLYCDKYGTMILAITDYNQNSESLVRLADEKQIVVDEEFFGTSRFGKTVIPCVSLSIS